MKIHLWLDIRQTKVKNWYLIHLHKHAWVSDGIITCLTMNILREFILCFPACLMMYVQLLCQRADLKSRHIGTALFKVICCSHSHVFLFWRKFCVKYLLRVFRRWITNCVVMEWNTCHIYLIVFNIKIPIDLVTGSIWELPFELLIDRKWI